MTQSSKECDTQNNVAQEVPAHNENPGRTQRINVFLRGHMEIALEEASHITLDPVLAEEIVSDVNYALWLGLIDEADYLSTVIKWARWHKGARALRVEAPASFLGWMMTF